METSLKMRSGDDSEYIMSDQTGKHVYHVFEDDEILDDQNIRKLDRLVHGPNVDAANWGPQVTNIRKGTTTDVIHHCGDHTRVASCFGQGLHQNYCPCWEYVEGAGWVRCGMVTKVMSVGCSRHRDDEMRTVYDRLRKEQVVLGAELNNPNVDPTEQTEVFLDAKDLARKAHEEMEEKLENGDEVDESMYVHQRLKEEKAKREREERYRRKDMKEVGRQQGTKVGFAEPEDGKEKTGKSGQRGKDTVGRMAERLGTTAKTKEKTKGGTKKK